MGFVKFLFKPHNAETSSNNFIVPTTKTTKAIKKNIYYEIELKFNLTAAPCYPPCCCISSRGCGEASRMSCGAMCCATVVLYGTLLCCGCGEVCCVLCCAVCRAAVSGRVTQCHLSCRGRAEVCHAAPCVVPCVTRRDVARCYVSCVTCRGVMCCGRIGVSHTICCAPGRVVGGACIVSWLHWGVPRGAA